MAHVILGDPYLNSTSVLFDIQQATLYCKNSIRSQRLRREDRHFKGVISTDGI